MSSGIRCGCRRGGEAGAGGVSSADDLSLGHDALGDVVCSDECEASEGVEDGGRGSHGSGYMMVWATTAVGSLAGPATRARNFQLLGASFVAPSRSSKASVEWWVGE